MSTDDAFTRLWHRRHVLLFTIDVSYRYHRKRQRFFDLLDKVTKALTVLAGATLFGPIVKELMPVLAIGISSLGLLSLIFAYGDRKQAHKELAEAFMQLQAQITSVGQTSFTEAQICCWEADFARLNSKEPPTLYALVTICQNEQAIACGHPEDVKALPWLHRTLASWFSFEPSHLGQPRPTTSS